MNKRQRKKNGSSLFSIKRTAYKTWKQAIKNAQEPLEVQDWERAFKKMREAFYK